MDQPLQAHTLNEAEYYLTVTPCPACGRGPWIADVHRPAEESPVASTIEAHCKQCGHRKSFQVVCEHATDPSGTRADVINPTAEPSRIVDVSQWLSLFYLLIESASSQSGPAETRHTGYRAALCLAEALKFYAAHEELPPESAFFSAERLEAFHKSPEKFARERLRDMQARLPKLDMMAGRVSRDRQGRRGRRKWWRFWR